MKTVIFPGTFDPITLGHTNLVERASKLFDKVLIAVADSQKKSPLFSLQERLELCNACFDSNDKVEAIAFEGLLVDFAQKHNSSTAVRGIRSVIDFEYEKQLANMNRDLYPAFDTVFLATDPEVSHISSSLVREISTMNGDVSKIVPKLVLEAINKKLGK